MDLLGVLLSIQLSQVQGLPHDGRGDVNLKFFMAGSINIQALYKKLLKIRGRKKDATSLKPRLSSVFLSEFSCKNIKLA